MASLRFNYRKQHYTSPTGETTYQDAINVTATLGNPFTESYYYRLIFTQIDNGTESGVMIDPDEFDYGYEWQGASTDDYDFIEVAGNSVTVNLVNFSQYTTKKIYCYAETPKSYGMWFVGAVSVATEMDILDQITLDTVGWTGAEFSVGFRYGPINDSGDFIAVNEPPLILTSTVSGEKHYMSWCAEEEGFIYRVGFDMLLPNQQYMLSCESDWFFVVYSYSDLTKYRLYYVPAAVVLFSDIETSREFFYRSMYVGQDSIYAYVLSLGSNTTYFHYADYPNQDATYSVAARSFSTGLLPGCIYHIAVDLYSPVATGTAHEFTEAFVSTLVESDCRLRCFVDGKNVTVDILNVPINFVGCRFKVGLVESLPTPPASNNLTTSHSVTYSDLAAGTYVVLCYVKTSGKIYYLCEPFEITEQEEQIETFEWDSEKITGEAFVISANEWNRLGTTVRDVLTANGHDTVNNYYIEPVETGDVFHHDRFNEVRFAIGSMNSTGIYDKSEGDPILADDLNTLRDKLNEKI